MPLLIVTILVAVVLGAFASRRVALVGTGFVGLLSVAAFVWAVADGRGDDPAWLVAVAGVVTVASVALANGLAGRSSARG
jgi:hypothetical protein